MRTSQFGVYLLPAAFCALGLKTIFDVEQNFNSLHAQRESAEAYIASQREAGWVALERHYDDGGFSGASIDRPALLSSREIWLSPHQARALALSPWPVAPLLLARSVGR